MNKLSLILPRKTPDYRLTPRYFYLLLLAICATYFGVEFYYINYSIFSVDDFWLAYHTYHYKAALPYRDFAPYKTVLGYYLMLLAMLATHGTVATLVAVKTFLTVVNTFCLALAAWWLKKIFSPAATLFALALLASTFCFLAYSTEIRVDLLAYWLCLFSLLCLLEQKWLTAGFCIGVAFLVSQKSLWCLIAMDCALFASGGMRMVSPLLRTNCIAVLTLGCYILFWSYFASVNIVLKSIFYDAYLIAHLTDYQSAIANFWKITLGQNLVLYVAGASGLLSLMLPPQRLLPSQRIFIGVYAAVMTYFFITYQQPFAYQLLVMMPALLILLAVLCEWVFAVFSSRMTRSVFCLGVIGVNMSFALTSYEVNAADNRYQRNMLGLMEQLLGPNENYLAGVPLIYSKDSIIPGLIHLNVPQLNYLYQPSPAMRKFMLASLYTTPVTQAQVLVTLMDAPIKFYINNNRMLALPPSLKSFLASEYQHFWGSIYLYAPSIAAGEQPMLIKFSGYYKVNSTVPVTIDGKNYSPKTLALLSRGNHLSVASNNYRLQLVPEVSADYLDFKYVGDAYWQMIG
ncbi:MAG: hypothetical protein V4501_02655 [Pseudomonadota bacterium]